MADFKSNTQVYTLIPIGVVTSMFIYNTIQLYIDT